MPGRMGRCEQGERKGSQRQEAGPLADCSVGSGRAGVWKGWLVRIGRVLNTRVKIAHEFSRKKRGHWSILSRRGT